MKKLKMDKIAKGLGADRRGKVTATGGYFGAAQLVEEIAARFKVPAGGGRSTDPNWDTKRLVPIASETLSSFEELAREINLSRKIRVEPMQLAAIVLQKFVESIRGSERKALIDDALQALDEESSEKEAASG